MPLDLYDAAGSRAADECARRELKLSGMTLMTRAARAGFVDLLARFPDLKSISVWCGKGNNAGDALLIAQQAVELGLTVQAVGLESVDRFSGDAATALHQAQAAGITLRSYAEGVNIEGQVIVDGLLGTGFNGALRAPFAEAIHKLNASGRPILSIDIPSGVNASTGAVSDTAVRATLTSTFITHKIGLHTGAGPSFAGDVCFHDLGVSGDVLPPPQARGLYADARTLPPLTLATYKHQQGHVLLVGGDSGMSGAIAMSTEAALRAGAGLVSVATRAAHAPMIVGRTPEAMVRSAEEDSWTAQLETADLVVLGPGLGREAWGLALFSQVEASGKPTVLDADGLYHLAARGSWQGGALFITPHVGEAARLLDQSAAEVEQDRIASARQLAAQFNASVCLKGPGSVVVGTEGEAVICQHGNPGMASGGMGDVLAGIAGGLLVAGCRQQLPPSELARIFAQAIALHSAAADAAAVQLGQRSLLARDVIAALPPLLKLEAQGD